MSNKKALLWSFEKDGIESFVFGTMHVRDERVFKYVEKLEDYISTCSSFACEMHLDEARSLSNPADLQIPGGKTLADFFEERKYKKLKQKFERFFHFDLEQISYAYPLLIVNQVAESLLQAEREVPLDHFLWNIASKNNRNLLGLETYENQMNVLKKIPMKLQLKGLTGVVKNPSKFRKQVHELNQLYLSKDVHRLFLKSKSTLGKMRKIMLYDRNYKMAEVLAKVTSDNSVFAAVGAAHLSGEKGILHLLSKEGFNVKPIHIGL